MSPTQRHPLLIMSWLIWMVIMVQFSTSLWSGAHTQAILEWLLPPNIADTTLTDTTIIDTRATINHLNFGLRKAAHLTEYAILGLLTFGVLRTARQQHPTPATVMALVGVALFALTDEFHQSFVPSRTATGTDVLIDIAGATIALMGLALLRFWSTPAE